MLDLGKSRVERGLEHRSWVVGAQLKPGTEPRPRLRVSPWQRAALTAHSQSLSKVDHLLRRVLDRELAEKLPGVPAQVALGSGTVPPLARLVSVSGSSQPALRVFLGAHRGAGH